MATPSEPRLTISVALCTYNGATYLREQWASLVAQEWLPDEVVVSDDGSTDGTRELVAELAQTATFRVKLLENPAPLGYSGNFGQAIAACVGELIFLCDQDDRWFPHKIRTLATYLTTHPEHDLVFGNATVADASLTPTDRYFWDVVRFGPADQARWQHGEAMHVLLGGNRVMGCAVAFRQSLRGRALPIPAHVPGGYVYDGWLALVAAATGRAGFVAEPLQLYRTHPAQQIGVRPAEAPALVRLRDRFGRDRTQKLVPFQQQQQATQTLLTMLAERVGPQATGLAQVRQRLAHLAMRATLPGNRLARLLPVARHLLTGQYHRYADAEANRLAPYVAAAGDLLE